MTVPWLAATRQRWCSTTPPGRGKEHAAALLAGYRGILQCDGYAAYKALATSGGTTFAVCWSHVRRGFYDLARGGVTPISV